MGNAKWVQYLWSQLCSAYDKEQFCSKECYLLIIVKHTKTYIYEKYAYIEYLIGPTVKAPVSRLHRHEFHGNL